MRHRKKVHHLGKAADQRKALIRSLATSLFTYGQITTTLHRAKALKEEADQIVTIAKRGDLHAVRQVSRRVYHQYTGEVYTDEGGREINETVLRRIIRVVGPRYADRRGGYTRIVPAPPRRGDAAPMAVIELVE